MGKGFEEQIDQMKAQFTKELNLTAISKLFTLPKSQCFSRAKSNAKHDTLPGRSWD
jgi:hypothetical protein